MYKVPPEKTQSHLESQFPPNDIAYVPAKLSDTPKIKFHGHSPLEYNTYLKKVFKMTGVKLTICRHSPIGIY